MKKLTIIFLLLINISTIAHADKNEGIIKKPLQYDVEVIIFEDAHARYINNEDWPQQIISDTPAPEETTELPENLDTLSIDEINAIDETNTPAFKNIKPAILNKEYKRINASKEYNVLFYGSWRQTGLDAKKAFEIDIQQLDNTHQAISENTVTGNFKLVLARYLHIYSKLNYQRKIEHTDIEQTTENTEATIASTESTVLEYENYPINNHRRMRSKVLHYIDHPLVGMLIQINPAKARTEETTEKSKK